MATYQQDDDHDRITHIDVLNLLRQDMREGFAQQREVFNARFDAVDSKVEWTPQLGQRRSQVKRDSRWKV